MCCFSPIGSSPSLWERLFRTSRLQVSRTNIYARFVDSNTQLLVYSMQLASPSAVAMILPIPVASNAGEGVLEFLSLEGHDGFFSALAQLFEPLAPRGGAPYIAQAVRSALPVHRVGAYEASFVPSPEEFIRLDAKFRLPRRFWSDLAGYDDYGFAVFQLAAGALADVHPMAFRFVSRFHEQLFFPTVHVHDGRVKRSAHFDHYLYYQGNTKEGDERPQRRIPDDAHSLIRRDSPLFRRGLHGKLPNADTWVALLG